MTKTNLIAASVLVVILVGVVGYFGYNAGRNSGNFDQKASEDRVSHGKLSWSFEEEEQDDETAGPSTRVTLTAEGTGTKYDAGTHTGSCSVIEDSSWELLEGEKTGVICWWAGGGTEIGVFEEDGKLVVKTGDIEESSGESEGFRGNFKLLLPLD